MKFIKNNNHLIKLMIDSNNYTINKDGTVISKIYKRKIGYITKEGYCMISFYGTQIQVHRLIWAVYGNQPLNDSLVINHKNGIKSDNRIENLELVTQSENAKHKYRVLKIPAVISNSKLTKAIADEIRKLHNEGWTYKMLMNKYNVSKTTISDIVNNKIWRDVRAGLRSLS